ncbi:MAG TPA: DUF1800 domain-containing protein [Gemmatimonadaceae bacterium]|nr:DUF1800 domain-containing protein [Gemmatimonadaceae bacterium]
MHTINHRRGGSFAASARAVAARAAAVLAALTTVGCAAGGARSNGAAPPAVSTVSFPAPSAEPRELAADQQIVQALNRLTFGARPDDVARVRRMGLDQWIATQLQPERIDDRAADAALARYETLGRSPADLMRDYPPPALLRARRLAAPGQPAMTGDSARATVDAVDSAALRTARQRAARVGQELASAKVARAVVSERQLQEVMVDFWENHFNVYAGKGPLERYYLSEFDEHVVRPHALGRFRDLLGAVAKSPAMLYYLDNWQSTADSGRPVLDARPMRVGGRGARPMRRRPRPPTPDPQLAIARTRRRGLNENYARELLELHTLGVDGGYTQHDVIEVARALTGWTIERPREGGGFVFRPAMHDAGEKTVLGHRLPAGRGIEDGEDVLDIVARHPATAHFIALELARRFVSDSPPPALVDRAARRFAETDGDIRQAVWTIVTSPEFYARAAYRAKVKSPFELVVSALRVLGAAPDPTPRSAAIVARLGEPLFGHQAPDGYPETGDAWINTGAILNRINFGLALAGGRVPGASALGWAGADTLAAAPRSRQVDGVVAALLGGDASPDTRAILLSGEHPFLRSGADTADAGPRQPGGLAQVVGLAIGSPEFQRR